MGALKFGRAALKFLQAFEKQPELKCAAGRPIIAKSIKRFNINIQTFEFAAWTVKERVARLCRALL